MKKTSGGLGKGLASLLGAEGAQVDGNGRMLNEPNLNNSNYIKVEYISTNPYQPRTHFDKERLEELAESIKVHGIIQPITVRRLNDTSYQLISGERRFQASKLIGLEEIPAFVRTASDQDMLEMGLIENIQRENLNALEIALSYQRLISECNLRQEDLGERVGKNRATVANYLRLLKLPPDIQAALRDGLLSMAHARALISIENTEDQLAIFNKIINDGLNVRQTEALVRNLTASKLPNGNGKVETTVKTNEEIEAEIELKNITKRLNSHLGTKIQIKNGPNNKGQIIIPFQNMDDFNRLLDLLEK